jgi:hypothetical protein
MTADITPPSVLHDVPSQPPTGRLRRLLVAAAMALALLAGAGAAGVAAVRCPPAFYRERLQTADDAQRALDDAAAGRRLVTKAAGLREALNRAGPWDAAFTEREINGWLAADLPANHASLIPAGVTQPRVRLEPRRLDVAAGVGGWFGAVAGLSLDLRARAGNRIEVRLIRARLGLLPVPTTPVLKLLAERLRPTGLGIEILRVDGEGVLVVTLPGRLGRHGQVLELAALVLERGELLVAGTTANGR